MYILIYILFYIYIHQAWYGIYGAVQVWCLVMVEFLARLFLNAEWRIVAICA